MNKLKDVAVPDIGDFHDVEVIEVHVADGDHVNKEDPLISLESDKATLDIPSTENGVVTKLMVKVGDKVSEGSNILSLEIDQKSAAEPADESSSSGTAQDAPESVIEAVPREAEQSRVADAKDDSASMHNLRHRVHYRLQLKSREGLYPTPVQGFDVLHGNWVQI